MSFVRKRRECGCDRIALAPPSGWRCSTGTQSRSPETEQSETERD